MSIIKLEEIGLLKQSEKSTVLLFQEMDGGQLFVQKTLQGRHGIFETLQDCPHPYLPKIHEVTISDEVTVVLEEYIDGQTLDRAALTEKQICAAVKELCVVLGFLHEKGIIHRDVKPTNIMLASDGHIRLIDFDAARRIKDNVEQDTKLMVTKGYAPPEQFGFSQTDARADIYSLGVTIEQLLGEKAKRLRYKRIISKCTNLNPDKRYQSVKAVKSAFSFGRRRVMHVSSITIVALLAWSVTRWFPIVAAPEVSTQDFYPAEDLLFYTTNGDYIIKSDDNVVPELIEVDMTGNGDYAGFSIPHSLDSFTEIDWDSIMSYRDIMPPMTGDAEPSFWANGIQGTSWPPSATELYEKIAFNSSDLTPLLTQITCVDADGDGIKELFVSKGDRKEAVLTTVWELTDIEANRYDLVGEMWGTQPMYLYAGGDIRVKVYDENINHYNYTDGILTEISVVDLNALKSLSLTPEEQAQSSLDQYTNGGWTYDDIARGYKVEDDEARLANWNTDDIVRGYRMVENENGELEKWTYNDFVRGYRLSEEEQAAFEEALEQDRLRGQQPNNDAEDAEDDPAADDSNAE